MMRGTGEGSQMMMESRVNFQKYAFESSQLLLLRAHTTFGTSPHCTQRWTTSKQSCTYTQSWTSWNTALLKTEGVIISCHQTGNHLPLWVPSGFLWYCCPTHFHTTFFGKCCLTIGPGGPLAPLSPFSPAAPCEKQAMSVILSWTSGHTDSYQKDWTNQHLLS